ncbi:molybdenum ABC transporter ATP-binding protein [soil metagenome]
MSVSFHVRAHRGEFALDFAFSTDARVIAVEGASGAGKTTLLKGLAGLIPVTSAQLEIDGRIIAETIAGFSPPPHQRRIGFVFQDARLFPHLTVADNVAFGRRYAEDPMTVEAALALVGLDGMANRWPRSLSGGEARRVAIARALCTSPQMLFLDEPFSGLDAGRRADLTPYLVRLREVGLPMLLVSHDPRDIEALAEVRVEMRSGRRVQTSDQPMT